MTTPVWLNFMVNVADLYWKYQQYMYILWYLHLFNKYNPSYALQSYFTNSTKIKNKIKKGGNISLLFESFLEQWNTRKNWSAKKNKLYILSDLIILSLSHLE